MMQLMQQQVIKVTDLPDALSLYPLNTQAQALLDRIMQPLQRDRDKAEQAIHLYLNRLDYPLLPVQWAVDVEDGIRTAIREGGMSASWQAACSSADRTVERALYSNANEELWPYWKWKSVAKEAVAREVVVQQVPVISAVGEFWRQVVMRKYDAELGDRGEERNRPQDN